MMSLLCRCTAVCSPYKYRERNLGNSANSSFYKLLGVIVAASTAINIPRFFETNIVR